MKRVEVALFPFLCGTLLAVAGLDESLERMEQTFEKQVERFEADLAKKTQSLNATYVRSLRKLETIIQEKGELDPLLAVRRERERFVKERSLGRDEVSKGVPELARVQRAFLESLETERIATADKVLDMAERYKKSLGRLQSRLTREGDLDGALRVKKVVSDVPDLPAVASASFVKADSVGGVAEKTPEPAPELAPAPEAKPEVPTTEPFGAAARERLRREEEDGARETIRRKYVEYIFAVGDREFGKAVTYMDPRFIEKVGADAMKPFLEKYVPHIEKMRAAGIEVDGGKVILNLTTGTATNVPRFRVSGGSWDAGDPSKWVRVKEDWYLMMGD